MSLNNRVEIVQINTYPIKSCKGLTLNHALIGTHGIEHDRKYMFIDKDNRFVSLRTHPILSQITPVLSSGIISCQFKDEMIPINHKRDRLTSFPARIWEDEVMVKEVDPYFSGTISTKLGMDVRLVKMSDSAVGRVKHVAKIKTEVPLSFVDGYPVHIVNEASLLDLSQRADLDVSSLRFRPNLVIRGLAAFEEEKLSAIETFNFKIDIIKPTVRCGVPNVDPTSGEKGKEPMKTLAAYRQQQSKIEFGVYGVVTKKGEVHINEHLSLFFN